MKKKNKNKKKWLRGAFDTLPNSSQYDGWSNGAGGISLGKNLNLNMFNDNINRASGSMKKWYKYLSIEQLYNHYIDNSQPEGYLESLPLNIRKMVNDFWHYDRLYSTALWMMRDLYKKFNSLLKSHNNKTQLPIQKLITLISTSGATPGYQTPFAFTGTKKPRPPKYLVKMGYKLVNELAINSKFNTDLLKYKYYRAIIYKTFKFDIKKFNQKLTGGLADKINNITKYPLKAILMGIKTLKLHTTDINIALLICMDHLLLDFAYYNKLKKILNLD